MVPAAMVVATRRMSAQFLLIRSAFTLPAMASRAFLRCSPMIRLSTDSAGNTVFSCLRYSRARASKAGSLFQPARLFVEELLQASLLTRVEAPQPEILSDSDLVSGDRLLPGCVVSQEAAVDAGL